MNVVQPFSVWKLLWNYCSTCLTSTYWTDLVILLKSVTLLADLPSFLNQLKLSSFVLGLHEPRRKRGCKAFVLETAKRCFVINSLNYHNFCILYDTGYTWALVYFSRTLVNYERLCKWEFSTRVANISRKTILKGRRGFMNKQCLFHKRNVRFPLPGCQNQGTFCLIRTMFPVTRCSVFSR